MIVINDIKRNYGNEMAATILCCRVFFGTATAAELSDFIENNKINWKYFLRLARVHRIRPLIYKTIIDLNIPADIKSFIRAWQLELIKTSMKQAVETERIILLLKKVNIEAIPYKGIAYSKLFFGDLISREMSDIDLVIRTDELSAAINILEGDGYVAELGDIYTQLGRKYFGYFKDYNLNKEKDGARDFHLELHWGVTEKEIGVDLKAASFLYNTHEYAILVKTGVLTLSPLSHFSSMLIHNTFKDNLTMLKNIVDISQALKLPQVENGYELLIKSFKGVGIRKSLSVNNKLSELLMGVSLPQIKRFGDSDVAANHFLEQICSRRAFSSDNGENMVARIKNTAMLQDSFSKKLRYYFLCLQFRFIPGRFDFRFIRLPAQLFFVYYLIKPFRTLVRSAATQET